MRIITIFLFVCLTLGANEEFENQLFGTNDALMKILLNNGGTSSEKLEKEKEIYLKNIADNEISSGLYIKGNSKKNFTKDRAGYDIRLEWNIFDDGYLGSRKDARKKLIQKKMEYEQNIIRYKNSNLQLALYKLETISNFIDYLFLKYQEDIVSKNYQKAKQEYDASLITASKFYEYKKRYEKTKRMLLYYKNIELEPYDLRLKSFMQSIENIDILNKNILITHAFENGYSLKNIQSKIAQTYIGDDWKEKLKTTVFIENKKYLFLENSDSETIAGVQVQIPLNFKTHNDRSQIIERDIYRLQEKNIKRVIAKNIENIYHKIDYYKNYIKLLKSEIKLLQQERESLHLKLQYPLPKQGRDINYKLGILNVSINKQLQDIWQKRTEILKLLLKLQNISGIELLSGYIKNLSAG